MESPTMLLTLRLLSISIVLHAPTELAPRSLVEAVALFRTNDLNSLQVDLAGTFEATEGDFGNTSAATFLETSAFARNRKSNDLDLSSGEKKYWKTGDMYWEMQGWGDNLEVSGVLLRRLTRV
jgi:hypothetical protein